MDVIVSELVQVVGSVLAAALVALVVRLLQKVGLQIDAEKRAHLEAAAVQAVARAEEWAAAQVKAKLAKKIPSAEKFERAVADVLDRVPGVDRAEAEAIVTSALPAMGVGASAGVRELGKALRSR